MTKRSPSTGPSIRERIENAGFEVAWKSPSASPACPARPACRRVEEGLKALPGVENASVNFATEKAVVEYDPASVGPDAMAEKVATWATKWSPGNRQVPGPCRKRPSPSAG